MTEHQLQATCFSYFKDKYPELIFWSSLSGIKLSGSGKYGVIAKERMSGFYKGIPDSFIALPNGTSLHIEFKVGNNKQQQAQIDMQSRLEALGHTYRLCYTFKQFKEIIEEHYKG